MLVLKQNTKYKNNYIDLLCLKKTDITTKKPYTYLSVFLFVIQFDYSYFDETAHPGEDKSSKGKYPQMNPNYESTYQPGMFFGRLYYMYISMQ